MTIKYQPPAPTTVGEPPIRYYTGGAADRRLSVALGVSVGVYRTDNFGTLNVLSNMEHCMASATAYLTAPQLRNLAARLLDAAADLDIQAATAQREDAA